MPLMQIIVKFAKLHTFSISSVIFSLLGNSMVSKAFLVPLPVAKTMLRARMVV